MLVVWVTSISFGMKADPRITYFDGSSLNMISIAALPFFSQLSAKSVINCKLCARRLTAAFALDPALAIQCLVLGLLR